MMPAQLFRPGDILACYGTDVVSRIIQAATIAPLAPTGLRLPPSHVAILAPHPDGHLVTYESTTFCGTPCAINGRLNRGAQSQEIDDRLDDYRQAGGRVDLYRLTPFWELDAETESRLTEALRYFIRHESCYDVRGAVLSGTRCLQLSHLFPSAQLESLFCSELIAAALQRVGYLDPDLNASRMNPGRLVRRLVAAGKYQRIRSYYPHFVRLFP